MVGSEQQRQQFCCLIPDTFKYENRCIILLGKRAAGTGWTAHLSAFGWKSWQASPKVREDVWGIMDPLCWQMLPDNPCYQHQLQRLCRFLPPNCQSTKKGQNLPAIILTKQVQSREPQAKANYSHGQKFDYMISREFVV